MIAYLLDTDIASYSMKRGYPQLIRHLSRLPRDVYAVSTVTQAEILYGLEDLPLGHPIAITAHTFLDNNNTEILPWPTGAAALYAGIRYDLESRGKMIGDRDVMIAAHAITINTILVTNNTRHFSRISNLRLENWLE